MSRGIIIAAPGSGSGKTTLTLAMLRRLRDSGISVASGKVGPDYIDPAYHAAASGRTCHNLDTWSMSDRTLSGLIADLQRDSTVVVVEGVMGLFDGAPDGRGSAADLSRRTGWPVVLVVDASPDPEGFLVRAAAQVGAEVDTDAMLAVAQPAHIASPEDGPGQPGFGGLPKLGRRIAVARDDAFAFCYPYVLDAWRRAGCELRFFSPLADESPADDADAVYLPGGYPELHAARLAAAGRFKSGLARCAERGAVVYGECGGYMVLGERLVDGAGVSHRMAGLLPVATSFESPRLSLGYREVALTEDGGLGCSGARFRGHEFHFASVLTEARGAPLFQTFNAELEPLGDAGLQVGNVMGSFVHLMDRCGR